MPIRLSRNEIIERSTEKAVCFGLEDGPVVAVCFLEIEGINTAFSRENLNVRIVERAH